LRPSQGFGFAVVVLDEEVDLGVEILDAFEAVSPDSLPGAEPEPALDPVEPRGVGRGEWMWKRGRAASRSLTFACLWVPYSCRRVCGRRVWRARPGQRVRGSR